MSAAVEAPSDYRSQGAETRYKVLKKTENESGKNHTGPALPAPRSSELGSILRQCS